VPEREGPATHFRKKTVQRLLSPSTHEAAQSFVKSQYIGGGLGNHEVGKILFRERPFNGPTARFLGFRALDTKLLSREP
jgi:hypothetical protein